MLAFVALLFAASACLLQWGPDLLPWGIPGIPQGSRSGPRGSRSPRTSGGRPQLAAGAVAPTSSGMCSIIPSRIEGAFQKQFSGQGDRGAYNFVYTYNFIHIYMYSLLLFPIGYFPLSLLEVPPGCVSRVSCSCGV